MSVVQHRPWLPRDYSFVMSSWLRSFKGSWYAGTVPDDMYWPTYQAVLERIVGVHLPEISGRPGRIEGCVSRVIVAVRPGASPDREIYGWVCVEDTADGPVLHYAYVKGGEPTFRRKGVARYLLARVGIGEYTGFRYTFKTQTGARWIAHAYPNARFDPRPVTRKREPWKESDSKASSSPARPTSPATAIPA